MSLFPSIFGTGRRIRYSMDVVGNPSSSSSSSESRSIVNARIDWKETAEAHVFKADLPGVKKGEVKVEILGGRELQISGDGSKDQKKDKNAATWQRFLRRFRLPENSKVDQVKAFMENGVLTVTVPKEEFKKPYFKSVQITG